MDMVREMEVIAGFANLDSHDLNANIKRIDGAEKANTLQPLASNVDKTKVKVRCPEIFVAEY